MKKLLFVLPLLAMLSVSFAAAALQSSSSVRGYDGTVAYVGSNSDFSFSKASYSGWTAVNKIKNVDVLTGQGTLQVVAETSAKKRIVLNLKLSADGTAYGTYWMKGALPVRVSYSSVTNVIEEDGSMTMTGVSSLSQANFQVVGLKVVNAMTAQ